MNNLDHRKIVGIVDGFKGRKIAIVGDVMLDHYIFGAVEKISPEAPVPVVLFGSEKFSLGGAANVANNVVTLGGEVILVGVVGEDEAGQILKRELGRGRISADNVFEVSGRPTIQKTRVIASGQQLLRIDQEEILDISGETEETVINLLSRRLKDWDVIIVSDYAKGFVTEDLGRKLVNLALKEGKKVLVDSKKRKVDSFKNATVLTPNEKEAFDMTGLSDMDKAGEVLQTKLNSDILITRGAKGMTLFSGGGNYSIPARAREVFDVTGAGDTVVAVLALALASGLDLKEAAQLSNVAGGISVGKMGAVAVFPDELKKSRRGVLK